MPEVNQAVFSLSWVLMSLYLLASMMGHCWAAVPRVQVQGRPSTFVCAGALEQRESLEGARWGCLALETAGNTAIFGQCYVQS